MNLSKFHVLLNEKDFKAVAVDVYEAHLRRKPEGYKQSYLNVLLHYIGELGELSQCPRKGNGMDKIAAALDFIKSYKYPLAASDPCMFVTGYEKSVKGTIGDELADCFLVMCVLMERLNREKGFEFVFHSKVNFLSWTKGDFDDLLQWAIHAAVINIEYLKHEIAMNRDFQVMERLMCMVNNVQYLAQFWEIDLFPFIQAKLAYNKLRTV